jgi:predicted ester cyclase
MIGADLSDIYRDYIACLNKQDWQKLERFVHNEVLQRSAGCQVIARCSKEIFMKFRTLISAFSC